MITIDDITFRVLVKGNTAKVASKGSWLWAPVGATYYSRARKAAELASGCKVTEAYTYRVTVYASLECADPAVPAP